MLKKILIISGVVIVLAVLIIVSIVRGQAATTKVVEGKAVREDLSAVVSGTGQIKPKTYANIGAETIGRITHLYVKEGDHVQKGQILATVENVQPAADVATQQATIAASKTDVKSYVAAEKTAEANLESAEATLEQKQLDFKRGTELYKDQLIPKSDYDTRKAAYDVAVAAVDQNKAAVAQAKAQTASAASRINENISTLTRYENVLDRTRSVAPFAGIVTNLPVREGETVVVGIQNAEGSTLMTIADMSVVTAEVKVDETDIVNVALGQPAEVTVDALPGKIFKGHVTLVGDQAILRSTGIATSQSTTGAEEAKDFKVVVTLDNPSDDLRPGLSTTAKITTAHKDNVLAIPIQALTLRDPAAMAATAAAKNGSASATPVTAVKKQANEVQGVFVVRKKDGKERAEFVPVSTGITGATDIEVTSGLQPGDTIVTGTYRVLRTLKNNAQVKGVDAAEIAKDEAS
jgi:HlyD family secretion protein